MKIDSLRKLALCWIFTILWLCCDTSKCKWSNLL